MDPRKRYELNEWILAAIDGKISPEDFAKLDQEIRSNPEAADHYAEFMVIYAGLRRPGQIGSLLPNSPVTSEPELDMVLWQQLAQEEITAETVEIEQPKPAEPSLKNEIVHIERRVSRLSLITSLVSIAALAMMIIFVYMNPRTLPPVIGVLSSSVDARWNGQSNDFESGQDFRRGTLNLSNGLARIRFDSGAMVILEGPAEVDLLSPNSMFLRQGRIVATVGRSAVGFVVNTPKGKVLDLGTEFGVHVDPLGESEVHVFQGEVLFYPDTQAEHYNVPAGKAKVIDQQGQIQDIPCTATAFARQDDLNSAILAREGSTYHRWKKAVFELHRDPSLVAHYFYEKAPDQPNTLIDSSLSKKAQLNGQFGSADRSAPQWVGGRWPEKSGVRFVRGKNHAIVVPASSDLALTGPITISTWVYFPDSKNKGGHLLSCRQDSHVNYQFSIFDNQYTYDYQRNRFEFLRFNQKNEKGVYSNEFIQQSNVWYNFAAVYDMHVATFYINGEVFDTQPYEVQIDTMPGEIIIGSMKSKGRYVLPAGDFDGIIDELMIFDRCLAPSEIKFIYETGSPAL